MSSCQAGRELPGDSILVGLPAEPNTVCRVQLRGWGLESTEQGLGNREYTEEGCCVPKERESVKYLRYTKTYKYMQSKEKQEHIHLFAI